MNDIGVKNLIAIKTTEFQKFAEMFIKSSRNIKKSITRNINNSSSDDTYEQCMEGLLRDTYTFNLIIGYCGMQIICSKDSIWTTIDHMLDDYSTEFYNDDNFGKRILMIMEYYQKKKSDEYKDYIKFLERIYSRFNRTSVSKKISQYIILFEDKIFDKLNQNPTLKIAKRHLQSVPLNAIVGDNEVMVTLNQENYYQLLDNVEQIDIRHLIEDKYVSRTKAVLSDFAKLILLRHNQALENGYDTYFKYVNRGKYDNSETIRELIVTLNKLIDERVRNEIDRIHQYYNRTSGQNTKLSLCDVIRYNRIHKNKTRFEPKHVFYVLFAILKKYFNISIERPSERGEKDEKGWSDKVIVYLVVDSETSEIMGKLYLDIGESADKSIHVPLTIKLADRMQIGKHADGKEKFSMPEVALIANYRFDHSMTYSDVQMLFREFGHVLQYLSYRSRVGLINYDEEFSNMIPLIMEYIAWDRHTVDLITEGHDPAIADHILMGRYIDMCCSIKIKCIDAKFDHLIHNSTELLEIMKNSETNKMDTGKIILNIYQDIYQEIMEPIGDMIKLDIQNIDPYIIVQEVNNSHAVRYSNLMNEIFAYVAYWLMAVKGVRNFRSIVLSQGVSDYREIIKNYIKQADVNCFHLYMKEVVKSPVDRTDDIRHNDSNQRNYVNPNEMTDDTNYFDDVETDSVSDQDMIISFDQSRRN